MRRFVAQRLLCDRKPFALTVRRRKFDIRNFLVRFFKKQSEAVYVPALLHDYVAQILNLAFVMGEQGLHRLKVGLVAHEPIKSD